MHCARYPLETHLNSLAPGRFKVNFRGVIFNLILVVNGWGISCETALIWMSLDHIYGKSTLVQVMAWCRQATSHYLSQCWPRSQSPYGVTRPQWADELNQNPVNSPVQTNWTTKTVLWTNKILRDLTISFGWISYIAQSPHDDVIKWKHFRYRRYRPFVRGIPWSPVNSPHKGQWRGALMFSFICAWINGWVNNREAGELRRHRAHYGVIVMEWGFFIHRWSGL